MQPPIGRQRAHFEPKDARQNSQKTLEKTVAFGTERLACNDSVGRPLRINCLKPVFVFFGRIHVTISGAKEATQKNNQNDPLSKAARPDPASPKATQGDRKGNQQAQKRKAPNVVKHNARAAPEKRNGISKEKTRMKKRMFRQMLENTTPELSK